MSAVCPACGVGVVPGYVRCPKCGAALPTGRRAGTQVEGGTAVRDAGGFPVVPAALAGIAVAVVVALALRGGKPARAVAPDAEVAAEEDDEAPAAGEPSIVAPPTPAAAAEPVADPSAAVRALDAGLKRTKLWGTTAVTDTRIDIRSGGCGDPAMAGLIEELSGELRGGGLTRLRCLEQSGRVVFERDL